MRGDELQSFLVGEGTRPCNEATLSPPPETPTRFRRPPRLNDWIDFRQRSEKRRAAFGRCTGCLSGIAESKKLPG